MYILVITETEVDSSIPSSQLKIEGFAILHRCDESTIGAIKVPEVLWKCDRCDENRLRGGVIAYVGDDIPNTQLIKHNLPEYIEGVMFK